LEAQQETTRNQKSDSTACSESLTSGPIQIV
jgi:hypothetical protein